MSQLPRIISVDDHVVEPPDLWWERLPTSKRELGPRLERRKGSMSPAQVFSEGNGPGARWADVWVYDDMATPLQVGFANVGAARDQQRHGWELITYDEMAPGCYDQGARLADMDRNHTEASICFPTVPRFCGQTFLERDDKSLALDCLRIYNDWMIDEWCGGEGRGRLIPLTLVPLWDADLAADEVRRCADKGSHAVSFPEATEPLGLPSLYSGAWKALVDACDETATVVNMHVGSSSRFQTTSRDAPLSAKGVLTFQNAMHALIDWVLSGVLVDRPGLKIALSEGQAGWLPFIIERLDDVWARGHMYEQDITARLPAPPSELIRSQVYACIFNDKFALQSREVIGMDRLMFETDYPHSDSTFPDSDRVAEAIRDEAGLDDHETWQLLRGNAIECYGLERHGIEV